MLLTKKATKVLLSQVHDTFFNNTSYNILEKAQFDPFLL